MISALLALGGTVTAIVGVVLGETKPFVIGLVLIFGGMVFARLYLGTGRNQARPGGPPADSPTADVHLD